MKTNHQRNFKDRKNYTPKYHAWSGVDKLPLSDRVVGAVAYGGDSTNGKHGIARSVRGAKKFVHSRGRFHENSMVRLITKNLGEQP